MVVPPDRLNLHASHPGLGRAHNRPAWTQNISVPSFPTSLWLIFPSPPKPTQHFPFPHPPSQPDPALDLAPLPAFKVQLRCPSRGPGPVTPILLPLEASVSCPSQPNDLLQFHRVLWLEPHLAGQGLAWLWLLGCAFPNPWVRNAGCFKTASSTISPNSRTLGIYVNVQA